MLCLFFRCVSDYFWLLRTGIRTLVSDFVLFLRVRSKSLICISWASLHVFTDGIWLVEWCCISFLGGIRMASRPEAWLSISNGKTEFHIILEQNICILQLFVHLLESCMKRLWYDCNLNIKASVQKWIQVQRLDSRFAWFIFCYCHVFYNEWNYINKFHKNKLLIYFDV